MSIGIGRRKISIQGTESSAKLNVKARLWHWKKTKRVDNFISNEQITAIALLTNYR